MKIRGLSLSVLCSMMIMSGCGPKAITTEDIREQEAEALEEIADAKEESVELANMKEQYSVDQREADLKQLRERKKEIEEDLKRLGGLKTTDAQGDTETLIKKLRARSQEIDIMMQEVKNQPKENWQAAVQNIQQKIIALEEEVKRITGNLPEAPEKK